MAFDGSYPRFVREAGKLYMIFVRRARCGGCGAGEPSLPDFVLARRRDSTAAVGAAVPAPAGVGLPEGPASLYQGVPGRTVRSWRQRFCERAEALSVLFEALAAERGAPAPAHGAGSSTRQAVVATRRFWQTARRRVRDVPPAWPLANVVVGASLLAARVDLSVPGTPHFICRSRAPWTGGMSGTTATVPWRRAGPPWDHVPIPVCRNEHDLGDARLLKLPLGSRAARMADQFCRNAVRQTCQSVAI